MVRSTSKLTAATAVAIACMGALPAHAQRHATPSTPLRLASPAQPVKTGEDIYIVQLNAAPVASYTGGTPGYVATRPQFSAKLDSTATTVSSYAKHLEDSHDRLLIEVGAGGAKLHSYVFALNGFAARLSAEQVSRLYRSGAVGRLWRDSERRLQTVNSAIFLGLEDQTGGLRADLQLRGEDVIVAVIDSGIAPGHPSLADTEELIPSRCRSDWSVASWLGIFLCSAVKRNPPLQLMYQPATAFNGDCEAGDGFLLTDCNNKLLGARFYAEGFLERKPLDPGEFLSPRDVDGHGTHIATTIAGNPVSADLFGIRVGDIAGIAPRARIAAYKACWLEPGETRASCSMSDLVAAIDGAVADGADIINYSVGNIDNNLDAPDSLALLSALDAGVLSVVAAGNDGPNDATIGAPAGAPWVLTVAASTQTGNRFDEAISIIEPERLAQRLEMKEASFTPQLRDREPLDAEVVLVDDGQDTLGNGLQGSIRDACESLEDAGALSGRIALLVRGGCTFEVKLNRVEQAGAIAAIVYNDSGGPITMNGDSGSVGIPAVMISAADGQLLVDEFLADTEIRIQLAKGVFLTRSDSGKVLGDFSSRGPSRSEPEFLKPDVAAPGVDIFAGHTPAVANGLKGELYQYLSGTSMAAPETAGVAALLKEHDPTLTPMALKSALMTTAVDDVLREDGATPATPFDAGTGHIVANAAVDPGLVFEAGQVDYAAYLCGLETPSFAAADCELLRNAGLPTAARDINTPSIANAALISGDIVERRVTNVGPSGTYAAEIMPPPGIDVVVEPSTMTLNTGQQATFSVRLNRRDAALDTWAFGRLAWSDGIHRVASPIAVRPATLRAPRELTFRAPTGSATVPVAFGYSGAYRADAHGLRAALTDFCLDQDGAEIPCEIADDPTNAFSFRSDNGVNTHLIELPPDQIYARFALFDAATDGNDDLDLYVFYCPNNQCSQIAQSGAFTSEEQIDLFAPAPGVYAILVHAFETDETIAGPGARYRLFAWSFGVNDTVGNLSAVFPTSVSDGDHTALEIGWGPLDPATRYLGALSHNTLSGRNGLTLLRVDSP